jgi:hypothetical protein
MINHSQYSNARPSLESLSLFSYGLKGNPISRYGTQGGEQVEPPNMIYARMDAIVNIKKRGGILQGVR